MAYDWSQWEDPQAAAQELVRAKNKLAEYQKYGEMDKAAAAQRHIQGVEGVQAKVAQLAQSRMEPQPAPSSVSAQPKIVRDTPYFVEQQFDPRRYEMPKFEEPVATLPGHMVTPALKQAAMQEWLQKVGVRNDERAFDYGMSQDAYARRNAEKKYNEAMALGFSERYGVPIKPMGSLENLFAQVKGIKPLDVQKMEQDQQYRYDNLSADQTYRYDNLAQDNFWKERDYELDQSKENTMNKTQLTSAIDQRILKAAQLHRENPGSEGLMGFIQNQIVPDLQGMMDMGLGMNDINAIIDRTVSAFTNGQFKTKNQYFEYLRQQMGDQQFNQWKKENDIPLNFNQQSKGDGIQTGSNQKTAQWAKPIQSAAEKHGVPSQILYNMMVAESGGNPHARSHAGAIGLMQFMPGTAKGMGINPTDPLQSIDGAARYLKGLYNQFGNWQLAVAAYNAGPGNVQKYGGVPPFKETQNYVRKVFS